MTVLFFIASAIAVIATALVITTRKAIHALLYLVVSFLALALVFYVLGAPFVAALEVIVYAGAIIVLFLFALMLIAPGRADEAREREWMRPRAWIIPSALTAALLIELIYVMARGGVPGGTASSATILDAAGQVKAVGIALFGPYLLGVELASVLLLAGLVAAHRLTQGLDNPDEEDAPPSEDTWRRTGGLGGGRGAGRLAGGRDRASGREGGGT
jgi:NADH-quinone oxidoreductase subunit J